MQSATLSFFKYLLGLRSPATADTQVELDFLATLAKGKTCIVEVGVYEGVASRIFCQNMDAKGKLYLVDPYFHDLKFEQLFKFSTTELIAKRSVQPWQSQLEFVRLTSLEAAQALPLYRQADLIFIDARHDYESVREDFENWSLLLDKNGLIAFHDSCICPARPDLTEETGPVRLCYEIAQGQHGAWKVVNQVDSITVFAAI